MMKLERSTKILLFLFLLTGVGALWTLWSDGTSGGALSERISVDTAGVTRIGFTADSNTVLLVRTGRTWTVDGKYAVNPQLMVNLLSGLSRMEIKSAVANDNQTKISDHLSRTGAKVSIVGDQMRYNFTITNNASDENSSYFIQEGKKDPYVIYVPGITGDMSALFKLDANGWRSTSLFRSSPQTLKKVLITYPSNPAQNVEITNAQGILSIKDMKLEDTARAMFNLNNYFRTNLDRYISKDTALHKQRLSKLQPAVIVELQDEDSYRNRKVSVYQIDAKGDGAYALVEPGNELVWLSMRTLKRIIYAKEDFKPLPMKR